MTVTDDELEASLRAWGAAYRGSSIAAVEPDRIADVFEGRRRPIWPMLAAALLVLAVAGSVVAYRVSRPRSLAGGARCPGQFSVHEVNEEQTLPVGIGIVLRYRGDEPCRISLSAPAVALIGADGRRYGGNTATGSRAPSAVVRPGGAVSFAIDNFLNCRTVPRQNYSLDVLVGGGHVSVPIGVRTGVATLCFVPQRTIGAVSRFTVSAPRTTTVVGRLVLSGGPDNGLPAVGAFGTVTFSGPITRVVQTRQDGGFEVNLPVGRYHVFGRSHRFMVNGAPGRCPGDNLIVAARSVVHEEVVCPVK